MFSIDDFGIGYSSMIYLKRLPFDQLKIDREFIRNIHRDPESRGVVEAIMAVSKQYGLKVTAEGVEEERKGLWANIHAKRKRGEKPNPPGHPDRPSAEDLKRSQK